MGANHGAVEVEIDSIKVVRMCGGQDFSGNALICVLLYMRGGGGPCPDHGYWLCVGHGMKEAANGYVDVPQSQ